LSKDKKKIHITYQGFGANQMVTGSAHKLTIKVNNEETNIFLDMGMIQSGKLNARQLIEANKLNVDFNDVECVIASHAHAWPRNELMPIIKIGF